MYTHSQKQRVIMRINKMYARVNDWSEIGRILKDRLDKKQIGSNISAFELSIMVLNVRTSGHIDPILFLALDVFKPEIKMCGMLKNEADRELLIKKLHELGIKNTTELLYGLLDGSIRIYKVGK